MINVAKITESAKNKQKENKIFFNRLKRISPNKLDELFHKEHERVFEEEVDCLTCANCCKTTSPIFYQRDIERVAKRLRMRPSDFIEKYLQIDEDKDYVLKTAPCPFLDSENYCSVYEDRPTACREYPHTDRKKIIQLMDLTYKNTLICPAVYLMVEKIKEKVEVGKK